MSIGPLVGFVTCPLDGDRLFFFAFLFAVARSPWGPPAPAAIPTATPNGVLPRDEAHSRFSPLNRFIDQQAAIIHVSRTRDTRIKTASGARMPGRTTVPPRISSDAKR